MPEPLLKKLDQLVLASLTLAAGLALTCWAMTHYYLRPSVVQIEQATPLHFEYLVDVNQADWPELAQLPGVGEILARRIVAERSSGPYRTTQDLLRVPGIGPRKLARMQRRMMPLPEDEMLAGDLPIQSQDDG